jgi:hypothetical protein
MPLAPMGCAVQMHESTNRQKTWDPHSLDGWYLSTSTKHYHYHKIFCRKMRSEQISDTVFFQHCYITQPVVTPKDQIVKAIGDLTSAVQQRINVRGAEEMEVLQKMNNILNSKKVTFQDPIPEPRVGRSAGNMQQSPKTILSPRVATATINKPLATIPINKVASKPPATTATKKLIVAKPFATVPNNGPTT